MFFRKFYCLCFLLLLNVNAQVQLPGFHTSPYFNEQIITFNYDPEIRIHINAPSIENFSKTKKVKLVFYALPNGNTIEQTVGKKLNTGDDWHYDIQHIGAQTRFIRNLSNDNYVIVYLETAQKSWPSWKSKYSNHASIIRSLVEYLKSTFKDFETEVILTGHSGGGRFTFSFLDAYNEIPLWVKRISFLDSNYGYDDGYGFKLSNWLTTSTENTLVVIAYNDSVALLNGNPIVSPTGGTWYRSKMMKSYFEKTFSFEIYEDSSFEKYFYGNRIKLYLKKNPLRQILHTVQVEKNGFVQGMFAGTSLEDSNYVYYGDRTYENLVQINIQSTNNLKIPLRNPLAKTGTEFMQFVTGLNFSQRENEIFKELQSGNIPNFIRNLVELKYNATDLNGITHLVEYTTMPDYLCIGSDSNFCRIPVGPITAQKIADLYGAVMPTRKLVDNIYMNSQVKLAPVTYAPIGNQNELVPKFIEHNSAIELQIKNKNAAHGQLTGGIKKDVVLSNKIIDPARPNHVVIYGWHQLNGAPIQPLTNIHTNSYVDYSHGIRFLNNEIKIDGVIKKVTDILRDPILYKLLSDESGAMSQPTYIKNNVLDVEENIGSIIEDFILFQNYPNPFNPDTNISFKLYEKDHITLNVYNTLGEKICNLVNEDMDKGNHQITFSGKNLPSGIYFYTLTASNLFQSKKMLLLK